MNLEEFVATTLVQIRRGIVQANETLMAAMAEDHRVGTYFPAQNKDTRAIEFDVAITASSSKAAGAKAGASIKVLGGGVDGKIESAKGNVSRVRFWVETNPMA